MKSRERVLKAINHLVTDKIPFDIGATFATGISIKTLYKLRGKLRLNRHILKMYDPYQMLGEIEDDFLKKVNGDCIGLWPKTTLFGTRNYNWKKWLFDDGVEVLVGEDFNTTRDSKGNTYVYPQGDIKVKPSGILPKNGYYIDAVARQGKIDENNLKPKEDFKDDYLILTDGELRQQEEESKYLYENTDYAIVSLLTPGSFNDLAHLPGLHLKKSKGVRNVNDWLMYHYIHPEYIKEVHEYHVNVALKNLELYHQAVGERIQIMVVSGADYGTQNGEMISRDMYREFILPYQKRINDWIHKNTGWKTFYHTCGSVINLLDDFIEAGIDIFNPVQTSAKGMDPQVLKEKYGDKLVLWGGAIDVQKILPFSTPEKIKMEVFKNLEILSPGGGFICATTHNIQADTPVENILAYIEAINEYNGEITII